jgi:hypothetical protein
MRKQPKERETVLPPSAWNIAIRVAHADDVGRIDVLAALDSARPIDGDALIAEVCDEPVAAIDLHNGRAVANPMRPTAEAVRLLQLRREQLRGEQQVRHGRLRHPFAAVAGLLR